MLGRKGRSKGDYNPYQNEIPGGEAGPDDVSNFQPTPDAISRRLTKQQQPQSKGDESSCSGTCEVTWKPVRTSGQ